MGELFNIEKMEKSIGKAKRRSTWKMIAISAGVIMILGVGGYFANRIITPNLEFPIADSFANFKSITGANEFVGVTETYPGILGGENHYKTYKWIEGKIVYTGEGGYGYGLFRDEMLGRQGWSARSNLGSAFMEEHIHDVHYNELGQRVMNFFYPQLAYSAVNQDLALLDEIPSDKLVEMALSFDQGYTPSEAIALIPEGVSKTWLWVNDVSADNELQQRTIDENGEITDKTPLVRNANTVYGYSVIESMGEDADQSADHFIRSISSGTEFKSRWQGEFKRLNETIAGEDGKLEVDDLVINGMVVTGTAESLKVLRDLPFIKASSLGLVVDKY